MTLIGLTELSSRTGLNPQLCYFVTYEITHDDSHPFIISRKHIKADFYLLSLYTIPDNLPRKGDDL